jgi:hypothetical protein
MFNTGTVGFPPKFIPDFSWGGASGFENYLLPKMFETTKKVCERKNIDFNEIEKDIITHVYKLTIQEN